MGNLFKEFPLAKMQSLLKTFQKTITNSRKQTDELLKIKDKTYKNFIQELEEISYQIQFHFTPISHINSVNHSDTSQEIYNLAEKIYTEYSDDFWQNKTIYEAHQEVFEKEKHSLNPEQLITIEKTLKSFRSSGCWLSDILKEKLKGINLKLTELSSKFSENLLKATMNYNLIITDPSDVYELPEIDKKISEYKEDDVTKWKFSLQFPSYISYMTYGSNRELRKKLEIAYTSRAPENEPIIEEILKLRQEKARILNFKNFAELSLNMKMASTPQEVLDFLNAISEKSRKLAAKEWKQLNQFAKKKGFKGTFTTFDRFYYSQKMKKELYSFDEELYREYFEKNSVLKGLLKFLEQLFGIQSKKIKTKVWHKKVEVYEFSKDNTILGRVYFDLEARKEKKGGAWMHNWQTHYADSKSKIYPSVAFIVCNFPESKGKIPSLLKHSDVVTLFHEMGHALHHICSKVNEVNVSGINGVEWDAVEFPSQFLENFAFCPLVLKVFAHHYKTKEVLPDEMITTLNHVKNFQSALGIVRQLEFGIFDMKIHIEKCNQKQVQSILNRVRKELSPFKMPKYNKFQNGFSHIFDGGYAAGYYSYKWAEVLSADAYFYFLDNGIFNTEVSQKFYNSVLSKGGSVEPMFLFQEFMGRKPDPNALLRLYGLQ